MGKILHLFNNAAENDVNNDSLNDSEKEFVRTKANIICSGNTIQHVFWGPIPLCRQTAETMMEAVPDFANAQIHAPVMGFGTRETLARIMTPEIMVLLKTRRHTMIKVLLDNIDHRILSDVIDEAEASLHQMFRAMKNQETAYGFFHEPFISLLTHMLNGNYVHALRPLGNVEFLETIGGMIVAGHY